MSGKLSSTKNSFLGQWSKMSLAMQPVKGHDGRLAGDFQMTVVGDDHLAWIKLIKRGPPFEVVQVLRVAAVEVQACGDVNLAIRVEAAQASGDLPRISRFEQQPVQADAGIAPWVLLDEVGQVLGKLHLLEALRFIERADAG